MSKRITEEDRVKLLTDDLFHAVEKAQGYFFVSDGETFDSSVQLFDRIRGRLEWGEVAVEQMKAFLRKHGELEPKRRTR